MATRWTYIDPGIAFNLLKFLHAGPDGHFWRHGAFLGPVLGAAVFGYLEEVLLTRFPYYYMLVFGIILIATILYLPGGLAGLAQQLWTRISGGKRVHA